MKRNKSMLQVLPCVLLCVALAFPGMKATVFAEDRIDTDGTMTENDAIPDNEGITEKEKENDPVPESGEFFDEDAALASMDGDVLQEGSESAAQEGLNKEDVFTDGEDLEEDGKATSGDDVFPEGNDTEKVDNGASAGNDFLQEEGNGDSSEAVSQPEMLYPVENNEIPEMTETGEKSVGAEPGAVVPGEENAGAEPGADVLGEESAGTEQDPQEDASQPEMLYPGEDNDIPEITETGEEDSGADQGLIDPVEESAGTEQDPQEDASQPEMLYPGEGDDIPEMTETGEEDSGADQGLIVPGEDSVGADPEAVVPGEDSVGADPGAAVPGEESADAEQDPSEDTPVPEGDGASSEMTALPEESAQDELKEISAGEPSIEADAEEVSDAVSYAPAAGICPLARELTYNGQAQELIDVEDIRKGTLCYSLDGEAFSPEIPTGTDAGEYIVYFRAAEEETSQVSSLTVTISKADVIYTAPSAAE